ncbi:hypothetical protein [Streptomyces sp. NPDC087787]
MTGYAMRTAALFTCSPSVLGRPASAEHDPALRRPGEAAPGGTAAAG